MVTLTQETGGDDASIFALVWANASKHIEDAIGPDKYESWISPLRTSLGQDDRLVLEAPSHFFRTYICKTFFRNIDLAVKEACAGLGLPPMEVDLSAAEDVAQDPVRPDSSWTDDRPSRGEARLPGLDGPGGAYGQPFNPWFTFGNFVVGESNKMAYECCQAFSQDQQLGNNLLLVVSDTGLGKSHLAQAAGSEVNDRFRKVCYLTARDYSTHYVTSINSKDYDSFNNNYRKCDFLVVDDITFFSKKPQFQNEICDVIDYLLNKGSKVVLTSSQPPSNIPLLSPACRSRLSSALLTPIQIPSFETRLRILQNLVKAHSYPMPQAVLELVAETVKHDVRLLQSCLTSLEAKANYERKPVDLSLTRDILSFATKSPANGEALAKIKELVCGAFNLDEQTLVSKSRLKKHNEARSIGIYLAKHLTSHSLAEIGQAFCRRHSTILYTYNKMVTAMRNDRDVQKTVDYLTGQLGKKM
ncbi:MAG: ATP-binding protein [Deltaproteobacteria bacterium]|nr:ATP-binding protein [Deltaproteobacteria bacterium]